MNLLCQMDERIDPSPGSAASQSTLAPRAHDAKRNGPEAKLATDPIDWWRWRESNPRPKMAPPGVYKLRLAFWFRDEPSHERDGSNLAS